MNGIIIKGIAGFYYVAVVGSGIYECKAKGLFRKEGVKPLVGDRVNIKILNEEEKEANIEEILPRKNELYRPAVANIDQMLATIALKSPEPNFGILDRVLIQMKRQEIPVIICFNKADLADENETVKIADIYEKAGYNVIVTSLETGEGLLRLKEVLSGKTTVLSGPSGVGKSSLINILSSDSVMETGGISRKLKRGRHTTRHSQLIVIDERTYICDTPGFTSFSYEQIEKEDLRYCFPEFEKYEGTCKFNGCVHVNEPGCSVKAAVDSGDISMQRYDSYIRIYNEIKEQEKKKYK